MQITKFYISNFRSLKDFTVNEFGKTTIFYGDNNVGKSSVLYALHTIFKRKKQYNESLSNLDQDPKNFYSGIIENFKYDFNFECDSSIDFKVDFILNRVEIKINDRYLKKILSVQRLPIDYKVKIEGSINRSMTNETYAEINLSKVTLNNKELYLQNKKVEYFPSVNDTFFKGISKGKLFEEFIEVFNDAILLIPSSRDMLNISYDYKNIITLDNVNSINFKQFLYQQYLNTDSNKFIVKINRLLSAHPFIFGNSSFAKIDDNIEIMVQNKDIRLPIKYLGTGVMQVLYILTLIMFTKSKIVCIEELEQNLSPPNQGYALQKLQSFLESDTDLQFSQILFSTHSRVFYNKKLADKIYLLTMKDQVTFIEDSFDKIAKPKRSTVIFISGGLKRKSRDQNIQKDYAY